MHEQDLAVAKGLVSVAWADGRVADEEMQVIDAIISAYNATPSEARELRRYAQKPRTLRDIPINDLSASDRRVLLQHAVLLSFVDGEQGDKEREILAELVLLLSIPSAEAKAITAVATERARELANLL